MNKQIRWLFLWLGLLGGLLLLADQSAAQTLPDEHSFDQLITTQMAAQRVPGLAVAITQGDQMRVVKGYGAARTDELVTPQTQFLIASLSKSFTAVAVLQLMEAGKSNSIRLCKRICLNSPWPSQAPRNRSLCVNYSIRLAAWRMPDFRRCD